MRSTGLSVLGSNRTLGAYHMEIPASPIGAGQAISGKVSWFGGPNDPTDSGHTASGGTTKEPGIAVYNRATLGGYWRVTAANGKSAVLKQTDLGPAPFTGRKIDVTYSALGKLGYGENDFPTGAQFKATYLGRNPSMAAQATTGTSPGTPALPASFNQRGYEAAQQKARGMEAVRSLIESEGGAKDNPLIRLLTPKVPGKGEYTTPGRAAIPGVAANGIRNGTQRSAELGGFLPKGAGYKAMRTDQGKDVQLKPGQALLATGNYKVVAVPSDPTGFGPAYPVVHFTSGPDAGQTMYLGHTDSAVRPGQEGRAGDVLAHTSKTGHNAPPGWAEIGLWGPNGPLNRGAGETAAGKRAAQLLGL